MYTEIILLIDCLLMLLLVVIVALGIMTIVYDKKAGKLTSDRSEKAKDASVKCFIALYFTILGFCLIWMLLSGLTDNQRIENAPSFIIQFHTMEWSTEYLYYDLL